MANGWETGPAIGAVGRPVSTVCQHTVVTLSPRDLGRPPLGTLAGRVVIAPQTEPLFNLPECIVRYHSRH